MSFPVDLLEAKAFVSPHAEEVALYYAMWLRHTESVATLQGFGSQIDTHLYEVFGSIGNTSANALNRMLSVLVVEGIVMPEALQPEYGFVLPLYPKKPAEVLPVRIEGKAPSNCRNQLRAAGKPYPKSGCAVCKNGGLMGCPYERQGKGEQLTNVRHDKGGTL